MVVADQRVTTWSMYAVLANLEGLPRVQISTPAAFFADLKPRVYQGALCWRIVFPGSPRHLHIAG